MSPCVYTDDHAELVSESEAAILVACGLIEPDEAAVGSNYRPTPRTSWRNVWRALDALRRESTEA